jgi:polyphosphate kinase
VLVDDDLNSHDKDLLSQETMLDNPDFYINRELSWVRFNARILEEAHDMWQPLLERIKFIAICGSNLDEFFMTRVARMIKKINKKSQERSMDGMTFFEQLKATRKEILPLIQNHADCWNNELIPALATEDIHIQKFINLPEKWRENLREFLKTEVIPNFPIPAHGFDSENIENLCVTLYVSGFANKDSFCILPMPIEKFGRLILIPQKSILLNLNFKT